MGFFCATYPFTVLTIGIVFCAAVGSGFFFFSVITDPVELWSPPESTTRLNKNYYDSHFQPFYRTTQLIVRAKNETPFTHEIFGDPAVQYSSVFEQDFLLQVLRLQNSISKLTGTLGNETVGLDDICFKPLDNTYNCTIQSVFEYWQSSESNLLKADIDPVFNYATYDWISHFETCVAAPTNINDTIGLSCLGR